MADVRTSYLIGRADRLARNEIEEHLEPISLTLNQATTLSVLATRPGLSNAALARRALVTPQAMHKVVRSLEEAGLIKRKASPQGGRSLETTITAKGSKALAQIEDGVAQAEAAYMAPLSKTERAELRRLLAKLTGSAG